MFITSDEGSHVDAIKEAIEQMSKGIDGEEYESKSTNNHSYHSIRHDTLLEHPFG